MNQFSRIGVMQMASNTLAIPLYVSPEEAAMGQAIFHDFIHQEFENQGLNDEDILVEEDAQAQGDHVQFVDENFAAAHGAVFGNNRFQVIQIGASIRELANEFAHSPQRQSIRGHADEVDLAAMTYDNFWHLLEEVFRNGITSSNLIALFYFCSDVLIKCARQGLRHIGFNLFRWALEYIVDKVCKWVHEHGGWEKAINEAVNNKAVRYFAIGFLVATVGWVTYQAIKK